MIYRAKIAPWKDGDGWQSHQIADRTANTLDELLGEINRLQLDMDAGHDGLDYSIDIYRYKDHIAEFWYTTYIRDGITIDGVLHSIS